MPKSQNESNIFGQTLAWICHKLEAANITYMITGGSAVGFWGQIRTTMDIDVVMQIYSEHIDSFLKSIEKEVYVDKEEAKKAIAEKGMFNIIMNETYFKIDCIPLNEEDLYEKEKFSRRRKMDFHGDEIFVISPEDLIISKLIWSKSAGGSERQLKDCEGIYSLNAKTLDLNYIKKWSRLLKIEDEFKRVALGEDFTCEME